MQHAIEDSTKRGEAVYDPFAGSGSTVAPAEQSRRVCYAMEIDPRYCDVIVERWQHLTGPKPVELMQHAIEDSTKRGEAVYDPFAGSGSTVAPAEQSRRVCYAMEIDPRYCDVIVERWQHLTGPKQIRGG